MFVWQQLEFQTRPSNASDSSLFRHAFESVRRFYCWTSLSLEQLNTSNLTPKFQLTKERSPKAA